MQKGTLYAAKPLGPRICKETSSNDLVSVYRKTTSRTPAAAAAAAAIIITTMQHASSEQEMCTLSLSLSISLTRLQCTSACASAGAMLWRSLQYALSHSRPPLHSYSLSLRRSGCCQPCVGAVGECAEQNKMSENDLLLLLSVGRAGQGRGEREDSRLCERRAGKQ